MSFNPPGMSLRTSILLLLVCAIVISSGLVGWVSYWGSREAVEDVGLQLRKEVSHRISEHLLNFLRLPHEINRANAQALRQGLVSARDSRILVSRFAEQVDLFPSISSIYFGNVRGGLANSGRGAHDASRYAILTDGFEAGPFRRYSVDPQGRLGEELAHADAFDARTRPWYTKAMSAGGPVWSGIYVLFTGQDMALAASRPVFDEQGRTLGVVSVDVFLSHISAFLQQLRIGSTGKAFIVERSGLLVAGSGTEPLFIPGRNGNSSRRLAAAQSRDPLVRGAVQTLTSKFSSFDRIDAEQHADFVDNGRKILMTVSPLRDPLGIDWLIVVAVPESDFMGRIGDNVWTTAALILGVLSLSLLIGTLLARTIVQPIIRLEQAASMLASGSGVKKIRESSRVSEVLSLTRSFNQMARRLSCTMQGMQRELGERQRAEEALSESEARYRTLVDLAVDGILLGSHEGVIIGANQCMCDLLGLAREDLIGKHVRELPFTRETMERTPLRFELLEQGEIVQRERTLVRADGSIVHVEMRSKMMPDGTYQSIFRDVTARRLAEEALRESEERLRMLSDNLPGGLVYQVETGVGGSGKRFSYISAGVEALHEVSVQDVLNDSAVVYGQIVPEDREVMAEREAEALSRLAFFQAEIRFCLPSGVVRWSYLAAAPRELPGGRVVWDGVEIDITERKAAEAALREAKDAAEEANRVKSEFLANMSHEIRTPLNGILGMMQLLRQGRLDEEQQRYVGFSITSAERLTRLLSDILDVSRIEAGKMTIFEAPFSVTGLVDSVVELFEVIARDKGLALDCAIHPDISPQLVGDEARVRQILFNLVGNALKYTDQGCVTVRISPIHADAGLAGGVCMSVTDTGVGIPDRMLPGIFEPFRQVEGSHTRRYEGAGLGLTIVRRLVELMHGSIAVQSEAGRGTTVRVMLPLRASDESSLPGSVQEDALAVEAGRSLRILLAEDEAINQLAMSSLLRKAGHDVTIAGNGQEALDILRHAVFDCVLMDVQMPVMGGIEATKIIRSSPELACGKDIPIIALTAHAMSGDRESFLQAGMDDYLPKPARMGELSAVLARIARKASGGIE